MSSCRVYIGRLDKHTRERDIERFFKGYGKIREIFLKSSYGFVEFDDYHDADDAVYELHGKELNGEKVIVEHARSTERSDREYLSRKSSRGSGSGSGRGRPGWLDRYGPPTRTENRVIVENLSSGVSWQDLKDYMRKAGEVTYADAHRRHKNEGVVEFASYSDMKKAIEKLDDTEINGRRIKLVEDKRRSCSHRSRSRSRSQSFRRSHFQSRSRSRSCSQSRRRSRSRSDRRSVSVRISRSPLRSGSTRRSKSKSPYQSKATRSDNSKLRSESRSQSKSPVKRKDDKAESDS